MVPEVLEVVKSFEALPGRLFLDTSVLQTLQDYGEFIWENVEPEAEDRIWRIPSGFENLDALRLIMRINDRAHFQLALSANTLQEVSDRRDARYLQWAYDVLDYCEVWMSEDPPRTRPEAAAELDSGAFGYLSDKDRRLVQDAVLLDCDGFLTMERRLPRNADHLERKLGLRVLRPTDFWEELRPWAALWL